MLSIVFILLFTSILYSDTITVASYNVENLFDLKDDGSEYDAYIPGAWNLTAYREKLRNISSVIHALDANIIALQEIESKRALRDLKDAIKKQGKNFRYFHFSKQDGHAVGGGILSDYPIVYHNAYPVQSSRAIVRNDIVIQQDTLSIFFVHWPAKSHPESKRILAAQVCSTALTTLPSTRDYLIMGDFNSDFDEACRGLTQESDDSFGKTGINHVLRSFRSQPGESPIPVLRPQPSEHYNPWIEIPYNNRWSYIYRGDKNTLDHILFPHSLFDTEGFSYVQGSFSPVIIEDALRDGIPFRWQYSRGKPARHFDRGYSDHLPLIAKLTTDKINIPPNTYTETMGTQGWICQNGKAQISIVNQMANGSPVIHLSGMASSTGAVAKLTGIINDTVKQVNIAIRGQGSIIVRARRRTPQGIEKWKMISPAVLPTKRVQYFPFHTDKWEYHRILHAVQAEDTVDVEIRSKKGIPFSVFACVDAIHGWYRHL